MIFRVFAQVARQPLGRCLELGILLVGSFWVEMPAGHKAAIQLPHFDAGPLEISVADCEQHGICEGRRLYMQSLCTQEFTWQYMMRIYETPGPRKSRLRSICFRSYF